ncbi:hypothetical protein RvY_17335 [Ramazzottius varieornatus]|uniref:HTH CENPB-type domain-containing protein n=1 Tax=Ramazzottius varieornatus TaxID=947166 RepID=A0A1D1W8U6_RAMVA|nr:hypothetical protein RvY_17335 [Ramazzottius varieornatus]
MDSSENDDQLTVEEVEEMSPMERAIKAVRDGMSYKKAAKTFKVARTTLRMRSLGLSSGIMGPRRRFTPWEEEIIKDVLKQCRDMGLNVNRKRDAPIVQKMAIAKGIHEKKFGGNWLSNFFDRHPLEKRLVSSSDAEKDAETVAEADIQMTDPSISLGDMNFPLSAPKISSTQQQRDMSGPELMEEMNKEGYLAEPQGVWIIAECLISLKRYYKKYYDKVETPGSDKPIRVLVCGNAAGSFLSPSVVQLRSQQEPVARDFTDFLTLIRQQLLHLITARKNVIFMDRPSSELRLMPDFVVACSETTKDVKLLPFPRFSVVKNWSYTCGSVLQKRWNHYVETANIQNDMQPTEGDFHDIAQHMRKAWTKISLKQTFQEAFEKTGLYPYQPEVLTNALESYRMMIKPPVPRRKIPHEKEREEISKLLTKIGLTKEQRFAVMKSVRKFMDQNLPEDKRPPPNKRGKKRSKEQIAAAKESELAQHEL